MNAYELADILDGTEWLGGNEFFNKLSNMLREQADFIRGLKQKPVAWMDINGVPSTVKNKLYTIPLYTTPQLKELSRNDVTEVIAEFAIRSLANNLDYYDFAEALIKKASEK